MFTGIFGQGKVFVFLPFQILDHRFAPFVLNHPSSDRNTPDRA